MEKGHTSTSIIRGSEERFEDLKHKGLDWKSFYTGWVEGRVDLINKKPAKKLILGYILLVILFLFGITLISSCQTTSTIQKPFIVEFENQIYPE